MANKKTNTYDAARDLCVAPALVLWLDAATGAEVSGPGEGVQGFGIVARQMVSEDGKPGEIKLAVQDVFVSKGATGNRQVMQRWIVGPGGKCSLGVPETGSVCLGGSSGRMTFPVATTVGAKMAAYAAKIGAALAKRKAA